MAATKNTNTPRRENNTRGYPVAAEAHCFAGALAVLAGGFAAPGSTATGLIAVGVFEREVDNSAGGNGDVTAEVRRGFFRFANSADADEITLADVGQPCYIVDDLTVAKTDGTESRSIAGIVDTVDDSGVWVRIDPTTGALAS